jgi:hypothetical protein
MEGPPVKRSIDADHAALLPSEFQTNAFLQKVQPAAECLPTT